jgi:hypothetical protein
LAGRYDELQNLLNDLLDSDEYLERAIILFKFFEENGMNYYSNYEYLEEGKQGTFFTILFHIVKLLEMQLQKELKKPKKEKKSMGGAGGGGYSPKEKEPQSKQKKEKKENKKKENNK